MAVDQEITELTELTDITSDDLFVIENDPSGTSETRKVKASNVGKHFVRTQIDGMLLSWNSANSLSVGVGACYAENGDFIDITTALTASSLSLSVSTWYHIYVYLSSGAAAMEVVTTAPTAWKSGAYSKTSATTRRYIGSVKTDSSGNIIKFRHYLKDNYIAYMKFAANGAPHRCLTAGTATTATAIALSGVIPSTSTLAYIRITNLADNIFRSSDDNGVGSSQNTITLTAGNTSSQNAFFPHTTDASQQIFYKYDASPSTGGGYVDVLGYFFSR